MDNKYHHKIKFIPLGGSGEMGKNLCIVEVDDQIFIFDAGIMYPEIEMLGIDFVIPDISYLVENKERVKGVFLSHGHEDHIGAVPYLLESINVPVYGTKMTLALVKLNVTQVNRKLKVSYREIDVNSKVEFGPIYISFFQTNHNIPGSVGICLHTLDGAVVYTGDFKFDQSARGLYQADIGTIAKIGNEGVLCLLSESSGAESKGYTPTEANVVPSLVDVFFESKGRIFVSCFATNISGVQHIFDAASQTGRKVAVLGKGIESIYKLVIKMGYLEVADGILIETDNVADFANDELVFLTASDKEEPYKFLQQMTLQKHRKINFQQEDTVIMASSPIPGRELVFSRTIDMLTRLGINVLYIPNKIHVAGHGSQEELKMMINLLKPQFLIPVHGDYKMLIAHQKIGQSLGMSLKEIVIAINGQVVEIQNNIIRTTGQVSSGNILVDGTGVGDVGSIVLRDRKMLSQDGVLIIAASVNRKKKKVVGKIEVVSKGFVYMKTSESLIDNSKQLVSEAIERQFAKEYFEWSEVKKDIRDSLGSFLFEKTRRRPLLMPVIMEVR